MHFNKHGIRSVWRIGWLILSKVTLKDWFSSWIKGLKKGTRLKVRLLKNCLSWKWNLRIMQGSCMSFWWMKFDKFSYLVKRPRFRNCHWLYSIWTRILRIGYRPLVSLPVKRSNLTRVVISNPVLSAVEGAVRNLKRLLRSQAWRRAPSLLTFSVCPL